MPKQTVLVVEDDEMMRDFLCQALETYDYRPLTASDAETGLELFRGDAPDLVVADIRMPGVSGLDFLDELRKEDQRVPVVMVTAYGDTDTAVTALRRQADDFLQKPFETEEFIQAIERQFKRQKRTDLAARADSFSLVYESEQMQKLVDYARRIVPKTDPVLIEGESGTGKEVFARFIHYQSPRGETPLVTVNCGAIPGELLESELFGHTEGAFTGASSDRRGLFQTADGGTILLDEIGDLPLELQSKLLRVLENKQVRPVGSDSSTSVDVRVLAASNRDLEAMVERGEFRNDLFYRLNVFALHVPPLRERPADIPVLVRYFLDRMGLEFEISEAARERLTAYDWPGNVRELKNVLRRLQALDVGSILEPENLQAAGLTGLKNNFAETGFDFPPEPDLDAVLLQLKRRYIEQALEQTGGNKSAAADLLGMNRTTLVETIKRLNLE